MGIAFGFPLSHYLFIIIIIVVLLFSHIIVYKIPINQHLELEIHYHCSEICESFYPISTASNWNFLSVVDMYLLRCFNVKHVGG
ncbi:hypothetical protein CROQUDRAFT_605663 [Cronartium quercuum f. sp. fusiforme G11]|uniref:Uncharacterized protein n=1 Tax=Cronartium quercuum f. sp. fusiforme G11 TaxID=708437 RepID=A0A9P6TBM8_9BASI|nr:hypothetical protein CROQUDRAFT_605663 [Cronartium quercuum f. sp. fusiforme G11]